jgi:hypothetical protein
MPRIKLLLRMLLWYVIWTLLTPVVLVSAPFTHTPKATIKLWWRNRRYFYPDTWE